MQPNVTKLGFGAPPTSDQDPICFELKLEVQPVLSPVGQFACGPAGFHFVSMMSISRLYPSPFPPFPSR
jgi:hypothetical protein